MVTASSPQGLMLMVDWNVLPPETQTAIINALGAPDGRRNAAVDVTETESYPLNIVQARQLIDGVDDKTRKFLEALVKDCDREKFEKWENYAWIGYADAWQLAEVADKSEFARGSLSGIHRRLRKVTNEREAELVFSYDEGGVDGKGSYYIDNWGAVAALREAFKPKQPTRQAGD